MKQRSGILIMSIIFVLFLMSSITGCGKVPILGDPGAQAPAVISVWYSLSGQEEQELFKQFDRINQEHPEVIVKGQKVSEAKFVNQVWNLQAGGEGPEIVIASRPVIFALYEKGALAPVLADTSAAYPTAKAVFTFNQQSYAAPWLADVPMLYYRQDKVLQPPASLADLLEKKNPIAVESFQTSLLSQWWKAEGGGLTLSGVPSLDSPLNLAFMNKVAFLRSDGLLVFDRPRDRFTAGEVNYLLSWASNSKAMTKAGVNWGSISVNSLVTGGKAILDKSIGIANSSVKTIPAMEEPIRMVEEELLKMETQTALHEAGGKMPVIETFYEGAKAESFNAQAAVTLKNAWSLEGYLPDWELIFLQDKAWQNIAGGAKAETALAGSQQEALILVETP